MDIGCGKYCHLAFPLTVYCPILSSWTMISALIDRFVIPATNSRYPRVSLSPFSSQQKHQSRLLQCVLDFFEDNRSQPSGTSFKLETQQSLVANHLINEPFGWNFHAFNKHQYLRQKFESQSTTGLRYNLSR